MGGAALDQDPGLGAGRPPGARLRRTMTQVVMAIRTVATTMMPVTTTAMPLGPKLLLSLWMSSGGLLLKPSKPEPLVAVTRAA